MAEPLVTVADLVAALDEVAARAAGHARRRVEIERQHAIAADLEARAVRISTDGECFDLGGDYIVQIRSMIGGPAPSDSTVVFSMAVLPVVEEDVEDFHGGWAVPRGKGA